MTELVLLDSGASAGDCSGDGGGRRREFAPAPDPLLPASDSSAVAGERLRLPGEPGEPAASAGAPGSDRASAADAGDA